LGAPKKPELSELVIPILVDEYVHTPSLPIKSQRNSFEGEALICEFDPNGVLTAIQKM
jgi:hypothetical protein